MNAHMLATHIHTTATLKNQTHVYMTFPTGSDLRNIILKFIDGNVSDCTLLIQRSFYHVHKQETCHRSFISQEDCICQDCLFLAVVQSPYFVNCSWQTLRLIFTGELNSNSDDQNMNLHLSLKSCIGITSWHGNYKFRTTPQWYRT